MPVGVLNIQIKFQLSNRNLELDYRNVPFSAWGELKQATGFTQRTLFEALFQQDHEAIVSLIWLERKQRERKLRYIDVYQEIEKSEKDDSIDIYQFRVDGRTFGEDTPDDEDEVPTTGSN